MRACNSTAVENQRPGTDDWHLARPAINSEIEGYASATSVERGEVIDLYVNSAASSFSLEVFRMGWYQGLGARRVFGPIVVAGVKQPMPTMDRVTGLVDCAWISPFPLTISSASDDWVSVLHGFQRGDSLRRRLDPMGLGS
jgi:hypothetical protein